MSARRRAITSTAWSASRGRCPAAPLAGRERRIAVTLALGLLGACAHPTPGRAPIVAVDVGHSYIHPGAESARGRPEFEFNRDLARAVKAALEGRGIEVRLINERGDVADLISRPAAAAGTDFFLSIHHDSVQPRYLATWDVAGTPRPYSDRFAGFSLFVSRANPDVAQSLACASAMGEALRAAGRTPSRYHAEPIPGEDRPFADAKNGVHYFDNLVVLKRATEPAVLLEAGVIINRQEELAVEQPGWRERTAAAIASGIARCLKRL